MTPEQFLASLRSRGFAVTYHAETDKLIVNPRRLMTDDEIAFVAQHRAALVDLVYDPPPAPVTDYLRRRLIAQMTAECGVTEAEAGRVVEDLEFTAAEARDWLLASDLPLWNPPDCFASEAGGCRQALWCRQCSPVSAFESYRDVVQTHLLVMGWSGRLVDRLIRTLSEEEARRWVLDNYGGWRQIVPEPATTQERLW